MRVGVIGDDGVAVFDHAIGEDAVEIERDDDGNLLAENLAGLREEPAFGVEFLLACHGPVHAEIDSVHRRGLADLFEKFGGDSFPIGFGEGSSRGDEKGAEGRDEFHVGSLVKHTQGTADLVSDGAVIVKQLVAPADAEVSVAAGVRIEGRDLLFAFGDENSGHGMGHGMGHGSRVTGGVRFAENEFHCRHRVLVARRVPAVLAMEAQHFSSRLLQLFRQP